jgi:hypothetical protein
MEQGLQPRWHPVLLQHGFAVSKLQPIDEAVRSGGRQLRQTKAVLDNRPLLRTQLDHRDASPQRQTTKTTGAFDVQQVGCSVLGQVVTAAGAGTCPGMRTPTSIHADVTACASGEVSP